MGSVAPGTAYALAGPFWFHKGAATEEVEEEISATSPEAIQGEGGEQILAGKIASTEVEIGAKSEQAKGIIYDNALQGQIKLEIKYHEPKLIKPELKGCEVKIGESNAFKLMGHLVWKWNGEKKQLEVQPQSKVQGADIIFTPSEISENSTELPKGIFTTITLKGAGCGVLAGTFKVEGSEVGEPKPSKLETFSSETMIATPAGKKKQHFWNGKESVGVETGLIFAGNDASLIGPVALMTGEQVAILPGEEVFVFPRRYKFLAVTEEKEFKIINRTAVTEKVRTGGIMPKGKAFEVRVGSGCSEEKLYAAGGECSVVIKPTENGTEFFEIVPKGVFPVRFSRLKF